MDRVDSRSPHSVTGETTGEAMAAEAAGLRRWLVLHVKPRTEKKVMRRLSGCRGFHYLPTYVRVMYGPLCGTVGYVKRIGARATLCINVDILGSSVEVSVSSADLEPFKE